MKRLLTAAVFTVLAFGASTAANAQEPLTDQEFVNKASIGNSTEATIGEMVDTRASSPEVKTFGRTIMQHHKAANEKLLRLAGAKNMSVPTKVDKDHQDIIDKLGKLKGEEFDKEFIKAAVDSHEKGVEMYEKASKDLSDAGLKGYATETLPTIKEHLEKAKELKDKV